MNLLARLGEVRAAQARVAAHRADVAAPAAALLARGRQHPLLMLGAAGGAGFVFGRLDANPLQLPGLGALLRGGLAEVLAQGARLLAEAGTDAGAGAAENDSA